MQIEGMLVTLFLTLAPAILVVAYITYHNKRLIKVRKSPLNTNLLRSPGESIYEKIESTQYDIDFSLTFLFILPLMAYIFYLKSNQSKFNSVTLLTLASIGIAYLSIKLVKQINARNKLTLGYEAELAVGQELNMLMRQGYYVFHDVNLDVTTNKFNVDHVVLGKSGVFAVETKGRTKPVKGDAKVNANVKYDGTQLNFPNWVEAEPVEQAKRQANTLQKWLSSSVGEVVEVKPVLAIPGWFVDRVGKGDVDVINGKNSAGYFNGVKSQNLSDKLVSQIAHQLEQISRNVKPKALNR